jgi:hypothetical protein
MADNAISEEPNRLTAEGNGYGGHQEQLGADREATKQLKAYETAVETRKLEIKLFWSRSLFFWGLIASAFVAYATLRRYSSDISVVIGCFGFVCSIAWSLGNRGGKFWQESWETKVERIEPSVTGAMFAEPEEVQAHKNFWLRGRRFSVSKLAIALSDYTIILWFAVVLWESIRLFGGPQLIASAKPVAIATFIGFSAIYGLSLFIAGRSTERADYGAQPGSQPDAAQ